MGKHRRKEKERKGITLEILCATCDICNAKSIQVYFTHCDLMRLQMSVNKCLWSEVKPSIMIVYPTLSEIMS